MWFGVSIWMEGCHQDVSDVPSLWEEVVLVVEADSEADARSRGELAGRDREHDYIVAAPRRHVVRWTFSEVAKVCEIEGEPISGAEVFARFLKPSEVSSLRTGFDSSDADMGSRSGQG